MNKIKLFSLTLILVLVASMGLYFVIKHKKDAAVPVSVPNFTTNTSSTTTDENGVTGSGVTGGFAEIRASDGSIIKVPALNADAIAKIPKPNLNRQIMVIAPDEATKKQIKTIIEQSIAKLKADQKSLDQWILLGVQLKIAGDYEGAREMWGYVTLANPYSTTAFANLGDLYTHFIKDYPQAEKSYLKVIAIDPTYISAYINLHELYRYLYQTDTTKMVDILKQGLSKNQNNPDLLTTLAAYYRQKGDIQNAKLYYNQALTQAKVSKNQKLIDSITSELGSM